MVFENDTVQGSVDQKPSSMKDISAEELEALDPLTMYNMKQEETAYLVNNALEKTIAPLRKAMEGIQGQTSTHIGKDEA